MAIEVTNDNFKKEVLDSKLPVLADFWAEWCVPCKMIGPVIEDISTEYADKLKVVKVNVDDASELAGNYNVISIPTIMLFKDGEVVNQMVGAGNKDSIEKLFKDLI